jgi:hypothetical protein
LDYVLDHVIHRPLTDIGAVRYLSFHHSSRSRGESDKDVEREMGIAGALNLIIEYASLGSVLHIDGCRHPEVRSRRSHPRYRRYDHDNAACQSDEGHEAC